MIYEVNAGETGVLSEALRRCFAEEVGKVQRVYFWELQFVGLVITFFIVSFCRQDKLEGLMLLVVSETILCLVFWKNRKKHVPLMDLVVMGKWKVEGDEDGVEFSNDSRKEKTWFKWNCLGVEFVGDDVVFVLTPEGELFLMYRGASVGEEEEGEFERFKERLRERRCVGIREGMSGEGIVWYEGILYRSMLLSCMVVLGLCLFTWW